MTGIEAVVITIGKIAITLASVIGISTMMNYYHTSQKPKKEGKRYGAKIDD